MYIRLYTNAVGLNSDIAIVNDAFVANNFFNSYDSG